MLLPAGAEDRRLLLSDQAHQAISDVDFAQLPVWRPLVKCPEHTMIESCRLQRMTENPEGTGRDEIIGAALRIAQQLDVERGETQDGFLSLRAAQAYLIAAAFEADLLRTDAARAHYSLAVARAGEVPRTMTTFTQTVSAAGVAKPPSIIGERPDNPRPVNFGAKGSEVTVRFYPAAQLVKEYATRALATLGSS